MSASVIRLVEPRPSGPPPLVGFRLFFPIAALHAALAMLLWIAWLGHGLSIPTHLAPLDWHRHEMLVGFTGAVIAGFLLTAMPSWTGRTPMSGAPLLALCGLWLAGRLGVAFSTMTGAALAAVLDSAFPLVLTALVGVAIGQGAGKRNLVVFAAVGVFAIANLGFHIETLEGGAALASSRAMLGALVLLVLVMGGRVVPAFTRNWLKGRNASRLPPPPAPIDTIALAVSVLAIALWTAQAATPSLASGALVAALSAAGVLNLYRLTRWHGHRTFTEPLVAILHLAWLFVALAFLVLALAITVPGVVAESSAMHLWSVGGVSVMCLAIMTRASLGHGEKPLRADVPITLLYVALASSAILRFVAGWGVGGRLLLELAAFAWCAAWIGFLLRYRFLLLETWRVPPARAVRGGR